MGIILCHLEESDLSKKNMSTLSGTEDSRIFDDSTENSRYKYHDDADVETPEYVSINEVISSLPDISEATLSGSGRGDGRGGGEVPLERYTVATIQGDQTDVMTEGDVIESIEESSNHLKGSARNILLPQLTDDRGQDFETKSPPISPKGKRSNRVVSLRDLTAQLIIASGDRDTDRKGCDGATRGTAADRMADTAEIMFSSQGDLPDGIHFDVEGRPKIDVEKLPNEAKGTLRKKFQATRDHIKENKDLFVDFLRPRKKFIWGFWWIRFKFLILPGSCIAALLFYACGNPPHGKLNKVNGEYVDEKFGTTPATASVSWWILFIAVRQVITFASAEIWELFLVDFLSFKTRILTSLFGPYVSLWIAQSKGWPFRAIVWGITNLIFLSGSRDFVNHWGYFQGWIDLFNGRNPSGNVLENRFYNSLILCSIGFGGATVAKRAILSNIVGKRLVGTSNSLPKSITFLYRKIARSLSIAAESISELW